MKRDREGLSDTEIERLEEQAMDIIELDYLEDQDE